MPVFKALYSTLPGCFPESRVGVPTGYAQAPSFHSARLWRCGLLGASGTALFSVCARACQHGHVHSSCQVSLVFDFLSLPKRGSVYGLTAK